MSIRKVGGIWFVKLGRVGFNFYVSRRPKSPKVDKQLTLAL